MPHASVVHTYLMIFLCDQIYLLKYVMINLFPLSLVLTIQKFNTVYRGMFSYNYIKKRVIMINKKS